VPAGGTPPGQPAGTPALPKEFVLLSALDVRDDSLLLDLCT
jgi:hypothetical protein